MKKENYHHGNLKEEFLRLAFEFVQRDDIDKLTLKMLADATETSRSAIYKHFDSKDALIQAIMKKGFEEFDAVIVPILEDRKRPLQERFIQATSYYIEWAKTHPNLYRLIFGKRYAHIREEFVTIKSQECKGFVALKGLIEEGQEQGIIQKKESFNQAIIVWSSLHGLASLLIDCFPDVATLYESLVEQMLESLMAGLVE